MADEQNHQSSQLANGEASSPDSKESLAIQVVADTTNGAAHEEKFCPAVAKASSAEDDEVSASIPPLPLVPVTSSGNAQLVITEEPRQRGFRFRYSCEGPSHGGLPGDTSEKNRKTYPTVQLKKYEGRAARVVVSLVTQDDPPRPHAHSLVGRHVVNGQCTVQIGPGTNWMATFPNLGILHVTKKNVVKVLLERYALALTGPGASAAALPIMADNKPGAPPTVEAPDEAAVIANSFEKLSAKEHTQLKAMAEEASRHMNLSVVRLCFQVYLCDADGNFTKPLCPCISQPVFDSKAPSASTLKICRMDRHSGSVMGGDEVYTLVDRVQKDDIEVRFFTESEGSGSGGDGSDDGKTESWSALANFAPSDVHRQFAIVLKTPAYCDTSISRPVNVWVQLRRRSDNETSEAKPFTYQPQVVDTEQLARKRLKKIPHFFDHYGETSNGGRGNGNGGGGGGGGAGGGGAAGGGGSGDPFWGSTGGGGGGGTGNTASGGSGLPSTGFGFNNLGPLSGRKATTAGGPAGSASGGQDSADRADDEPAGRRDHGSRRREHSRGDRSAEREARESRHRRRGVPVAGGKRPRTPAASQPSRKSRPSASRQWQPPQALQIPPHQSSKKRDASLRVRAPSHHLQLRKGAALRHRVLRRCPAERRTRLRSLQNSRPLPHRRYRSA